MTDTNEEKLTDEDLLVEAVGEYFHQTDGPDYSPYRRVTMGGVDDEDDTVLAVFAFRVPANMGQAVNQLIRELVSEVEGKMNIDKPELLRPEKLN